MKPNQWETKSGKISNCKKEKSQLEGHAFHGITSAHTRVLIV